MKPNIVEEEVAFCTVSETQYLPFLVAGKWASAADNSELDYVTDRRRAEIKSTLDIF